MGQNILPPLPRPGRHLLWVQNVRTIQQPLSVHNELLSNREPLSITMDYFSSYTDTYTVPDTSKPSRAFTW